MTFLNNSSVIYFSSLAVLLHCSPFSFPVKVSPTSGSPIASSITLGFHCAPISIRPSPPQIFLTFLVSAVTPDYILITIDEELRFSNESV